MQNTCRMPPIEYNTPHYENQRARIYANGHVTISISMQLRQKCYQFDLGDFPFDVQRCISTYGTWTYHNRETSLSAVDDDLGEMIKHLKVY